MVPTSDNGHWQEPIKALTVIGTNSNYLIKSQLMSANVRRLPTLPIRATLVGCDKQTNTHFIIQLKHRFQFSQQIFLLPFSIYCSIDWTSHRPLTNTAGFNWILVRRWYQYYPNDLEWLYIHTIEPPYSCYQLLHPTLMLVWYNKRWYCSNMSILAIPPIYCQY